MTLSDRDYMAISPHESQILTLLDINEVDQIDRRVEIPSSGLETALRDLYKRRSEYDCIMFESPGRVHLLNTKMEYILPFQLAKVSSCQGKYKFGNGFLIDTINHNWGNLHEERPPIKVVRPAFWTNQYCIDGKSEEKKDNQIQLHFGSLFKQVNLIIDARLYLEGDGLDRKYRPASAFGYKLL